ncbi:MAG: restriction endonuclease subunit S [Bacteroidetes bacterium]|nr:restriction endonuclease subunit S [Bacteroidota bacterium]
MREDWVECELKEIFEIVTGNTPSKKEPSNYGSEIPFVKPPNLWNKPVKETQEYLTNSGAKKSRVLPPFSTLITCIGNLGRVGINKEVVTFNQQINAIKPIKHIYSFYTFYQAQSPYFKLQLEKKSSATTVAIVNKGNFQAIRYKLPPLPEQRVIVSKIEQLFSELDNGIANLTTAQAQLKVYRQAVLKKAFEGGFTNSNIQEGELPKNWKWIESGELFSFVTSGSRGWAKYYSESGAIFIRITNLNFDTLQLDLRESKLKYVNPPNNSEGLRTKVEEGDFLFSITGYLGMFAIAPKLENAFVNQHVSLCRPKDGFDKKYVGYWIISKTGGHYHLNQIQRGAVKAGLNLDDLKSFPVPFPSSVQEQHQIVQEIESRLSVCDKLEESIAESLEKAEALRQSILKKAFEGKLLTQQELAACKMAKDYEPASVLLERIKKEKKE